MTAAEPSAGRRLPDLYRQGPQAFRLPEGLSARFLSEAKTWSGEDRVRRLWGRDAALWTGSGEERWLGWLDIIEAQLARARVFESLREEARGKGFARALLLGMGGSSLCPEVLRTTFGRIEGFPELRVLDSTDPAQVKAFEKEADPAGTLFIVSSKSGTTLEPDLFLRYFWDRAAKALGGKEAGRRFLAITDPGSRLEKLARELGFRHVFHGVPSIGGRYSALSDFGMIPAAVMGLDVPKLLDRAREMASACGPQAPLDQNPGVALGLLLGAAAKAGQDKATFIASPGVRGLQTWLEQLLAESTGKEGRGIIPVACEPLGDTEVYGEDRVFVYLRLLSAPDRKQDQAAAALERAGRPVVRIELAGPFDLGREFFRWEIATAVAGAVLGINPFDQPDVEASKIEARKLTAAFEGSGALPPETPILEESGVRLFADEKNFRTLDEAAGKKKSLAGYLRAHLGRLRAGDYFALLAFLPMSEASERTLDAIRAEVRERKRVATCLGFGPRFLHSTGQAFKGGPDTGVFLQVTCEDAQDLPIPGSRLTFGAVKAAQARGDFEVLARLGRRALRADLGPDPAKGLAVLRSAAKKALAA